MSDLKISQLTQLVTAADGDLIPIVDISEAAASDRNKYITAQDLLAAASSGSSVSPSGITAWNVATTYDTANKPIYVSYNGVIYEFVKSSGTDTGTTPGTDGTVWARRTVADLAIYRTGDTINDSGATFQFGDTAGNNFIFLQYDQFLVYNNSNDTYTYLKASELLHTDTSANTLKLLFPNTLSGTNVIDIPDVDGTMVVNSGTPANNYLAVWTSSSQIEGPSNLTFDGTTLTIQNNTSDASSTQEWKDGSGTVVAKVIGNGIFTSKNNSQQTLTDAATITWNAANGYIGYVALGGDRTLALPTNVTAGHTYKIIALASGAQRVLSFATGYRDIDGAASSATIPSGDKLIGEVTYDGTSYLLSWIIVDV